MVAYLVVAPRHVEEVMTTPCCWPFCGIYQKECDCWKDAKKEVMPNDAGHFPVPRPVAPPPVSEAGGDLLAALKAGGGDDDAA